MNNVTKRLKKLVENRKTDVIVTKQNLYRQYKNNRTSTSSDAYISSSSSEENT